MQRLYSRIVFGIILAVLAGWIAVALLLPRIIGLFQEGGGPAGGNLSSIAERLDGVPQTQWADELQRFQSAAPMQLRIVDGPTLLEEARLPTHNRRLPNGIDPTLYVPLQGGAYFLVAGPLLRPSRTPMLVLGLVFVLVLTVTASIIVGFPLVTRLRRLQHAVGELGGGNWAVRLDSNAEGALSELAESINRMAAQLQREFQEREALLQTVSHELGTPLARMRFQIELLEAELQARHHRNRLSALTADLDELDELSTELVSWMEPNARSQCKEVFPLAPVLESLVELECERKPINVSVDVRVHRNVQLSADRRQFQRAIENLLRNALRYAQDRIIVEAASSDTDVTVEVRDDGPGIPAEHREQVFHPFKRLAQPCAQAHHRGLGLGLAIVRRIVEAHGGSVVISEAVEGGTKVLTRWPRSLH
jgi:signal transduction histidine kinase